MSRWWIPVGILLNYLSVNLIFTSLMIGSGFRTLRFGSLSMEPTIFVGDKFVADNRCYHHRLPSRDDLVLVRVRDGVTVKRVIAVGGDMIEGKDRRIILNGKVEDESFIQHKFDTGSTPEMDTFGPVEVPQGKYFVMGDNRDISLDSRTPEFGLVDHSAIVGRPLYGYRFVGNPLSWELH